MRIRAFLLCLCLPLLLSAFDGKPAHEEPLALPNIELGASAMVGGCVNAITGDYVESETDLTIFAPEPLSFSRMHSSSDFTTRHLHTGWRHNLGAKIVASVHKDDGVKWLRAFYIDHSGQSGVYTGNYIKQKNPGREWRSVVAEFNPSANQEGFTNCNSGIISARTNPKNTSIRHHHEGSYDCYVRSASKNISKFEYDKDLKFLLLLEETTANRYFKKYDYDKYGCLTQMTLFGKDRATVYGQFNLIYDENKNDPHILLTSNDGRQVKYLLNCEKNRIDKHRGTHSRYSIIGVRNPQAPDIDYEYSDALGDEPGLLITKRTLPDHRIREITYYDEAHIHSTDCHRTNRVRQIWAPVGENGESTMIHRFGYPSEEPAPGIHVTRAFDAYDNETHYHYNNNQRLTAIIRHNGKSPYNTETFYWGSGEEYGYLKGKLISTAKGTPLMARLLDYDEKGNITCDTTYGQVRGDSKPLKMVKHQLKLDDNNSYSIRYTYSQDTLEHLVKEEHGNGKSIHYGYHPHTDLLACKLTVIHDKILYRQFFSYDKHGVIQKMITDNGTTLHSEDLTGVTQRKIIYYTNQEDAIPIGMPLQIKECYLDPSSGTEKLLSLKINHYSPYGQLLSQEIYDSTNTHRYTLSWEYDAHGNLLQETNALGETTQRKFDTNDNVIWEQGPNKSHETTYHYDHFNRLIMSESIGDNGVTLTTTHRYDLSSNRIQTTDPHGNTIKYKYDALNRLIATIHPPIQTSSEFIKPTTYTEYNELGHPISQTDPEGNVSNITPNIYGKPITISYPDGTTEKHTYHDDGTLKNSVARNGVRTEYTTDPLGRILQKNVYGNDNQLISEESFDYNAFHLTSQTNPNGQTITYQYDPAGRLSALVKGDSKTTYGYDALGQLAEVREFYAENQFRLTKKQYDLLNRPIEEQVLEGSTNELLKQINWIYNADGKIISETIDNATQYTTYNAQGKPEKTTDPEGNITRYDYHYGQTYEVTITNPLGIQTVTSYDSHQRIQKIIKKDPYGNTLSKKELSYNTLGDINQVIETVITPDQADKQIVHYWQYDFEHKLLKSCEAIGTPEQKTVEISYNKFGQKTTCCKPDGVKLQYTYDAKGRLSELSSTDDTIAVHYTYDKNDNPIIINDLASKTTTTRLYDNQNRLIKEVLGNDLAVNYAYDPLNRPISTILPDKSEVDYSYNASHLKQITRKGDQPYTHTYNSYNFSYNLLEAQLPGSCGKAVYAYDKNQSLQSIQTNSYHQQLKYDPTGNLIETTIQHPHTQKVANYGYDGLNQLTQEKSWTDHTYQYDSLHNRIQKDSIANNHNSLNQLIQSGTETYAYDPNGNRISSSDGTTYTYDALDRLTAIVKADHKWVYTYDPLHRRLTSQKFVKNEDSWQPEELQRYLYQGENEVGCYDSNNTPQQQRILGVGKGAEIGATIAIELKDQVYVPTHDHNGNIVNLCHLSTGEIAERYQYTAFGEEQIFDSTDQQIPTSQVGNPWRFSSKRTDPTGMVYYGRRYYEPQFGRWLTPDPLGYEAGPNVYAYLFNSPLTHFDLYGLEALAERSFFSTVGDFASTIWNYAFSIPGTIIESCGQHMIPLPIIRNIFSMCGTVLAGKHFHENPTYKEVGTHNHVVGDKQVLQKHVKHTCTFGLNNTDKEGYNTTKEGSDLMEGQICIEAHNPGCGIGLGVAKTIAQKLGVATSEVLQLANTWRDILENDIKAIILHDAHSQGGQITANALELLTPEQRARISVTTYGSAKIINKADYGLLAAKNYISSRDPVPFIADPVGVARNYFRGDGSIEFVQSRCSWPDHGINGETYKETRRAVATQRLIDYR